MVIDSSALVAIPRNEVEGGRFQRSIERAARRLVGTPTMFETSIVMLSRFGDDGLADLVAFVNKAHLDVIPFEATHLTLALDAFRRFGKGRHPAGLNFGDCISYALAKALREPLLFKGDDFARTDVTPAA